jgi:hypothetical protein
VKTGRKRNTKRIDLEVPLNDFMREGAGAEAELQDPIDRMFNGALKVLKANAVPLTCIGAAIMVVWLRNIPRHWHVALADQ